MSWVRNGRRPDIYYASTRLSVRWRRPTSTAFPKYRTYGLGGEIDLVVPSMDDRIAVEVIDEFDDALFQFVF
jgi:hypothetical protein